MLIQIGRRENRRSDDVVGSLLDCHARIRTFTSLARRIAAREGSEAEVAEAAARVERYFRVALPLHVADEELSIRPRLLAASAAPDVALALDAMTEEHGAIEALLAGLLPRWSALAVRPSELASLAAALAADSAELEKRFDVHLEREERVLFPALETHLAADAPLVRAEMAARRAPVALGSPEVAEPGSIRRFLAADHERLGALLGRAVSSSGAIDDEAYSAFRAGLARHIGMEEKILFAAVRRLGEGVAPAELTRLREDHGKLVALLVPSPSPALVERIKAILEPHDAIEEREGGVYDQCERLLGPNAAEVQVLLGAAPDVPMRPYYDGPLLGGAHRRP
ncbi:Ferredoxin reductase [Minicystis rosea]|nr:Ferredoxin reductase [Minicystis rosea]